MNSDSSAPLAKRLRLMSAPAAPEKNDDVISGGLVLPPEVWARVLDCKFMHAWYYLLSCSCLVLIESLRFFM